MKRCIALFFLLSTLSYGQAGLEGGAEGLHQRNTKTVGQWGFSFGTGGKVSNDQWAMARGGNYSDENGKVHGIQDVALSFTGNINASLGLLPFVDVGAVWPIYYDHVHDEDQESEANGMLAGGLGDLDVWVKVRAPLGDEHSVFSVAGMLEVFAPTGKKTAGIRPRHVWNLNANGYTDPYTAGNLALAYGVIGSADLSYTRRKFPIRINAFASFVYAIDSHEPNAFMYALGANLYTIENMDFFIEYSGEMRVQNKGYPIDPFVDPMYITPGVRFTIFDGIDVALGFEISGRNFINPYFSGKKEVEGCEDYQVNFKGKGGNRATYCYTPGEMYGLVAMANWTFGGTTAIYDEDEDGVSDKYDLCAHTPYLIKVDKEGCPYDDDKDGVPNELDVCGKTPAGAVVDSIGCPFDSDNDKVLDGIDKCPNSKLGAFVNEFGCERDVDQDGVPDDEDICPNTLKDVEVDSVGCPINKKLDLNRLKQSIRFKSYSAKFTKESYGAMNDIAALMIQFPHVNLEIQGHTDNFGDSRKNKMLSLLRARSVEDYLVEQGIDPMRLRAVGYGADKPVATNATKKGRMQNQRVELIPFVK